MFAEHVALTGTSTCSHESTPTLGRCKTPRFADGLGRHASFDGRAGVRQRTQRREGEGRGTRCPPATALAPVAQAKAWARRGRAVGLAFGGRKSPLGHPRTTNCQPNLDNFAPNAEKRRSEPEKLEKTRFWVILHAFCVNFTHFR